MGQVNVGYSPLKVTDMQDPTLSALNQQLRQLVDAVNQLQGLLGDIPVGGNLDLGGKYKILNPAP